MHEDHEGRTDRIGTDHALIVVGVAVALFTLCLPWTTQVVYGVVPVPPPDSSLFVLLYLVTFGWARVPAALQVLILSIAASLAPDLKGLPPERKREVVVLHGNANLAAYMAALFTILTDIVATGVFTGIGQ